MSGQVLSVDEQIMIFVELPELAVDDVKVLVAEKVGDGVDVLLFVQQSQGRQQVGPSHLSHRQSTAPRPVHNVENPRYHLQASCVQ